MRSVAAGAVALVATGLVTLGPAPSAYAVEANCAETRTEPYKSVPARLSKT